MTDEPSIINIIQEMIKNGESEEKINSTLKDLGLNEKQISNLMLIAQADTFSLLKGEISKITKIYIQDELPKYKEELYHSVVDFNEKNVSTIKEKILSDVKQNQNLFEQEQIRNLKNMENIVGNVKDVEDKLQKDLYSLDLKFEEKVIGSTKSIKFMRIIAFILGITLISLTAFKFFTLGVGVSIDFIIMYVLTLSAGISLSILSLI